ncbi:uncharacterized protein LOC34621170 [Cyclospora cayetanensis]|uniref:Vacuolar protein sorting-associated protein 54 n=1 Tax=Cyclospora cayetanensis TaxID=88456 RepID=A0A6P6RT42_9EIME|nr:uncharacterized protein LOC34621170 [Cyclospora cayetanensis]
MVARSNATACNACIFPVLADEQIQDRVSERAHAITHSTAALIPHAAVAPGVTAKKGPPIAEEAAQGAVTSTSAFSFLNSDSGNVSSSYSAHHGSPSTALCGSGTSTSTSTCSSSRRGLSHVVVLEHADTPYRIHPFEKLASEPGSAPARGQKRRSRRSESSVSPGASPVVEKTGKPSLFSPAAASAKSSAALRWSEAGTFTTGASEFVDASEVLAPETHKRNLQEIENAQHISAVVNVAAGLQGAAASLVQQQQSGGLFGTFASGSSSLGTADSSSFMPLLLLGGEQQQQHQQRIRVADFERFFSSLSDDLARFERNSCSSKSGSKAISNATFECSLSSPAVDLLVGGIGLPAQPLIEQQEAQHHQKKLLQDRQQLLLKQLLQEMPSVFFSASFDVSQLLSIDSHQLPKQLAKLSDWLDKVESGLVLLFPPFSFFDSSIRNIHRMQQQAQRLVTSCHELREELLQVRSRGVELGLQVLSLSKQRQRQCVLYRQLESLQSLGALCSSIPLLLQLRDWRTAALLLHSAEELLSPDLLRLTAVQQLKAQVNEDRQRLKTASQSAFVSESLHFFFAQQQREGRDFVDGDLLERTLITTKPCHHLPDATTGRPAGAGSWFWTQCTLLPGILEGRALYDPSSNRWLLRLPSTAVAAAAAAAGNSAVEEKTGADSMAAHESFGGARISEKSSGTWVSTSSSFAAALFNQAALQIYGQYAEGWASACRLDEEQQELPQQRGGENAGFAWEERICAEIGAESSLSAALEILLPFGLLQRSLLQLRQRLPSFCRDFMRRTIVLLLSKRGALQQPLECKHKDVQQDLQRDLQQQNKLDGSPAGADSKGQLTASPTAVAPSDDVVAATPQAGVKAKSGASEDLNTQPDLMDGRQEAFTPSEKAQAPDHRPEGQQQKQRLRAAQLSAALAALSHGEFCSVFRDVCSHVLSVACRLETWVSFVLLRSAEFGTYRLSLQEGQLRQDEGDAADTDDAAKLFQRADSLTRDWRVVAAALVRVAEALGCLYAVQQRLRTRVAQILLQSLNVTVLLLQQQQQQQNQCTMTDSASSMSHSSHATGNGAAVAAAAASLHGQQPVFFGECSGVLEEAHAARILQLDVLLRKETWEKQPLQQSLAEPLAELLRFASVPTPSAEGAAAQQEKHRAAESTDNAQHHKEFLQGTTGDVLSAADTPSRICAASISIGAQGILLEGENFAATPSALVALALVRDYLSLAAWLPSLQSAVFSSLSSFLLHFARVSVHLTVEGGAVQQGRLQRITAGALARVARSFDCILFFVDRLAEKVDRQQREHQQQHQHQQQPQQQPESEETSRPPQRQLLSVLHVTSTTQQPDVQRATAAEAQQQPCHQHTELKDAATAFLHLVRREEQRSATTLSSDPLRAAQAAAAAAAVAGEELKDGTCHFIPPLAPLQAVRAVSRHLGLVTSGVQSGTVLQRLQQAAKGIAHSKSLVFDKLVAILVDRFEYHATLWVSSSHPPVPEAPTGSTDGVQPQKKELPLPHQALRELVKDISSMHRVLVKVLPLECTSRLFALAFHAMAEVFCTKLQQQQKQGFAAAAPGNAAQDQAKRGGAQVGTPYSADEKGVSCDAAASADVGGAAAGGRLWSLGDRLCVDCICLFESLKGLGSLEGPLSLWVKDLASACARVAPPSNDVQELFAAALPPH